MTTQTVKNILALITILQTSRSYHVQLMMLMSMMLALMLMIIPSYYH